MGLFSVIIVGLIAGWLASLIMKGKRGIWTYLILGVVGGIIGGIISWLITGVNLMSGINLTSIVVGLLGSIVVIFLYRLIKK